MNRASFLKRMALAAIACAFVEVTLPEVTWGSNPGVVWIKSLGPQHKFKTLNDAVVAAEQDDTIYLPPGEYVVKVIAKPGLTFRGTTQRGPNEFRFH